MTMIVHSFISGTPGNDVLYGHDDLGWYDHISAREGDDVIFSGIATAVIDGGEGSDTVSYEWSQGSVHVDLALGEGLYNAAQDDTYFSIENVIGSNYSDLLSGDIGANRLDGGAGHDTLMGGLGADALVGGAGIDTASYEDNWGSVFVNLNTGQGFGNAAQGDTYSSIENVVGSDYADYFIGDGSANTLNGAGGDDTLIGGLAADQLVGGTGTDTASYEDNWGSVFVNLNTGQGFGNAAQGDTYSSIENVVGSDYADFLIGDGNANTLDGKGSADTVIGGGGADIFAFTSALGGGNVDTITDFASGSDKIALDDAVFTAIGGLGALNPNAFFAGTAAHDADDRIVYDAATGNLYYDADGNGIGAQVLFANLQSHPVIAATDFSVI